MGPVILGVVIKMFAHWNGVMQLVMVRMFLAVIVLPIMGPTQEEMS
jgi:hypothetical protein